ncbi:hypothetical protein NQZ68_016742 [Dissostichus eleginoides]|nr:hypothetical protein NQZ68_016742 [Dissostichus eleginoides]
MVQKKQKSDKAKIEYCKVAGHMCMVVCGFKPKDATVGLSLKSYTRWWALSPPGSGGSSAVQLLQERRSSIQEE